MQGTRHLPTELADLDSASLVPLRASQRAVVRLGLASRALRSGQLEWLGARVPAADMPKGRRAYRCDLRLPVRALGRAVDFHRAALVYLGPVSRGAGHVSVDVSWRSANLAPLFPVFAGHLTVKPDIIALEGWYAPPGGRMGMALDRLLLRVAAQRTASWFLRLAADALNVATAPVSTPARRDEQEHAEDDDHDGPE